MSVWTVGNETDTRDVLYEKGDLYFSPEKSWKKFRNKFIVKELKKGFGSVYFKFENERWEVMTRKTNKESFVNSIIFLYRNT